MRQIENRICKYVAITAIISLMDYHLEEVCEHLLSQPLPLDPGTRWCWREIGNKDSVGCQVGVELPIYTRTHTYYIDIYIYI